MQISLIFSLILFDCRLARLACAFPPTHSIYWYFQFTLESWKYNLQFSDNQRLDLRFCIWRHTFRQYTLKIIVMHYLRKKWINSSLLLRTGESGKKEKQRLSLDWFSFSIVWKFLKSPHISSLLYLIFPSFYLIFFFSLFHRWLPHNRMGFPYIQCVLFMDLRFIKDTNFIPIYRRCIA